MQGAQHRLSNCGPCHGRADVQHDGQLPLDLRHRLDDGPAHLRDLSRRQPQISQPRRVDELDQHARVPLRAAERARPRQQRRAGHGVEFRLDGGRGLRLVDDSGIIGGDHALDARQRPLVQRGPLHDARAEQCAQLIIIVQHQVEVWVAVHGGTKRDS